MTSNAHETTTPRKHESQKTNFPGERSHKILKFLLALPATLFIFMGYRWVVFPQGAADAQLMPLLSGTGLSSQIADLGALFLGMGLMITLFLITAKRTWLYAPALLLLMIAGFRVIAWILHGAALIPQMIVIEAVIGCLLLFAAKCLGVNE